MIPEFIAFVKQYSSSLTIGIPLLAGCYFYNTQLKEQRILFWYVLAAALTEIIATALASNEINNLPGLHIFTVTELAFFVWYYKYIFKQLQIRLPAKSIIGIFAGLAVLNVVFAENLFTFNTNGRSLECLVLIFLSLYYFFSLLNHADTLYITRLPSFWGNTAILFYFSGTIFIFAYSRMFLENFKVYHASIWTIHSFFNTGFNILLAKALWNYRKA